MKENTRRLIEALDNGQGSRVYKDLQHHIKAAIRLNQQKSSSDKPDRKSPGLPKQAWTASRVPYRRHVVVLF